MECAQEAAINHMIHMIPISKHVNVKHKEERWSNGNAVKNGNAFCQMFGQMYTNGIIIPSKYTIGMIKNMFTLNMMKDGNKVIQMMLITDELNTRIRRTSTISLIHSTCGLLINREIRMLFVGMAEINTQTGENACTPGISILMITSVLLSILT